MSIIYNEMKQPIKHKGQICKGDIVYIEAGGAPYKVTECKDGSGVIKSFVGFKRDITFIEGKAGGIQVPVTGVHRA